MENSRNKKSLGILVVVIGFIVWFYITSSNDKKVIDSFNSGKTIICKDNLVSKDLGFKFNKNDNSFVNEDKSIVLIIDYCRNYEK